MKRAALLLLAVLACGTAPSGATFTANTGNAQGFSAASDFGVHVDMVDPGSPRTGTVTLSATATETAGGTITQVVFETSVAGAGTWSTACTDTSSAGGWSCGWVTSGSGTYDVRARATSSSGYTRTSATWPNLVVDNTAPSATVDLPASWIRGTIQLKSSGASDNTGGSGVAGVAYEYKTTAGSTWSSACSSTTPSDYACNFSTAGLTNGTSYDFRARATDAVGNVGTWSSVTNKRVDNANPTGAVTGPTPYLSGIETMTTSAADAHSGVASITVQYSPAGASSWSQACIATTSSGTWTCDWDTTQVTSQLYDLRVVVVDGAGNSLTSATLANQRVDNVLPTTTLSVPAGTLSGTAVAMSATAGDSGSGVKNVSFQRSPAGAGTWTEMCLDPTSTYTCTFDTTLVPDALYDLRSVATDNADNQSLPSVLSRRVDNNVPSPSDVQTADGGGTPGVIQTGDTMTLTYTEQIDPTSIIAGWDGTGAQSIYIRFAHHNQGDRPLFYNSTNTALIPLAASPGVVLEEDYVPSSGATFTGTLTQSGTSFTVTLGTKTLGNVNATAPPASTMVWTPSNGAKDFLAKACTTATKLESGSADREF